MCLIAPFGFNAALIRISVEPSTGTPCPDRARAKLKIHITTNRYSAHAVLSAQGVCAADIGGVSPRATAFRSWIKAERAPSLPSLDRNRTGLRLKLAGSFFLMSLFRPQILR